MTTIAIIDYGVGNVRSVQRLVAANGADVVVTADAETLRKSDGIILPGVGAFGAAMERLGETGLIPALRELALDLKRPFLGICLGMQLLSRRSDESPSVDGLGLIDADCHALHVEGQIDWRGQELSVPHMGWNAVLTHAGARLFDGIPEASDFYFAHSYFLKCDDPAVVAADVDYGGRICCAVQSGKIFGAQFHPEKSQGVGQAVLRNFIRVSAQAKEGPTTEGAAA